jgi:hypothetical protein
MARYLEGKPNPVKRKEEGALFFERMKPSQKC